MRWKFLPRKFGPKLWQSQVVASRKAKLRGIPRRSWQKISATKVSSKLWQSKWWCRGRQARGMPPVAYARSRNRLVCSKYGAPLAPSEGSVPLNIWNFDVGFLNIVMPGWPTLAAFGDSGRSGTRFPSSSELSRWTPHMDRNLLRQVVYEGLREDKPAGEVRRPVPTPGT
jgi:hypothetical protein